MIIQQQNNQGHLVGTLMKNAPGGLARIFLPICTTRESRDLGTTLSWWWQGVEPRPSLLGLGSVARHGWSCKSKCGFPSNLSWNSLFFLFFVPHPRSSCQKTSSTPISMNDFPELHACDQDIWRSFIATHRKSWTTMILERRMVLCQRWVDGMGQLMKSWCGAVQGWHSLSPCQCTIFLEVISTEDNSVCNWTLQNSVATGQFSLNWLHCSSLLLFRGETRASWSSSRPRNPANRQKIQVCPLTTRAIARKMKDFSIKSSRFRGQFPWSNNTKC